MCICWILIKEFCYRELIYVGTYVRKIAFLQGRREERERERDKDRERDFYLLGFVYKRYILCEGR
jgi:hypothetical protein